MASILVTGGAGFIGSHVCEALLNRGDSVICIDNLDPYYSPSIKEKNLEVCKKSSNFSFVKLDLLDKESLDEFFDKNPVDKVIHLAAKAGVRPSIKDPAGFAKVNILGTINLLEAVKERKLANFLFASSSSVYGDSSLPFSEDSKVDSPISPYAATKKAGELLCASYHNLYHIPITCLRFFTVYGPRGRPDMAPFKFTKAILEGRQIELYGYGSSRRDYTYITDIVSGLLSALDKNLDFEIINLGESHTVELKEFIKVIEKALGKKAKVNHVQSQPGDVKATYADISKAKALLGYDPKIRIDEGMRLFAEWLKVARC